MADAQTEVQHNYIAVLRYAVESPFGVIVRAETFGEAQNVPSLRAKGILYRLRSTLGDPEISRLMIRQSPDAPNTELWIIKNERDVDADPEATAFAPLEPESW